MNIKVLHMCMVVMLAISAKISNAHVTDDTHNVYATDDMPIEHKNGTCTLTEDELDEVLGGLEEVEHMLKQIKSVIGDM